MRLMAAVLSLSPGSVSSYDHVDSYWKNSCQTHLWSKGDDTRWLGELSSVRLMAAVLSRGAGMDPARGGGPEASAAASCASSSPSSCRYVYVKAMHLY